MKNCPLLIKKCSHCDSDRFSMNDREVAWQYAFSAGVASRNNLQLDYDSVEYEVINTVSLEDILNMSSEIISIQVKCDFDLSLKLSSLIKRCLPLSSTRCCLKKGIFLYFPAKHLPSVR